MRHKIEIRGADRPTARLLRRCVRTALKMQKLPFRAKVAVTVTDDEGIRALNRGHRGVDAATDVLSFPLLDWVDGEGETPGALDYDPESRCVELGDVVLSFERAKEQAERFGHGVRRECGYLTVHSVLHLLGYDHVDDEARRRKMRAREEEIMTALGLAREVALEKAAKDQE